MSFPEVNWKFLQSVYGWSGLQYQAWARGFLEVRQPNGQTIAIFASGLLEFSVDSKRHFGGDFYNHHQVPVILYLSQGQHAVDLRLIRDVRAMGATGEPNIAVGVEVEERPGLISIDQESLLVSDTTQERLGSGWASINVQNNMAEGMKVLSVASPDVGSQLPFLMS